MRAGLAVTLAIIASLAEMHARDLNALGQDYVVRATDVARRVLLTEFSKHPERVRNLSITFSFQVDARGRPHNVKVVSKTRNPWATDTARRALTAAEYPPIPKQIVQTGADMVNLQGDFDANPPRSPAQSGIPPEAIRSATFSYQSQINTIVLQAVIPELAKHFNLLGAGSVKFSFRLDRGGSLSRLRVTSSTSNRFVEQTTIQRIQATRFPPIPKKVIAEQGHDFVDVDSEINLNRN